MTKPGPRPAGTAQSNAQRQAAYRARIQERLAMAEESVSVAEFEALRSALVAMTVERDKARHFEELSVLTCEALRREREELSRQLWELQVEYRKFQKEAVLPGQVLAILGGLFQGMRPVHVKDMLSGHFDEVDIPVRPGDYQAAQEFLERLQGIKARRRKSTAGNRGRKSVLATGPDVEG